MKNITSKTKTPKAPKASTTKTTDPIPAGAEPEPGNAQGITINDSTEVIKADESQATEAEVIKPTEQPEATETAEVIKPTEEPEATETAEVIKPTEEPEATELAEEVKATEQTEPDATESARQDQMKADLTKLKAGDKKRKASVKAAKASKATPEKATKVAEPAKAKATKAPKPAKATNEPKAAGTSKKDQVLALISRENGATLEEIMTATAWQKHTVRGFIAILGKKGTKIESFKGEAGARTYKAA